MQRPARSEYDPYYENYISLVEDEDLLPCLEAQPQELFALMDGLPEEKGEYRYLDGKWSINEVISHVIDGERMFGYRVLRISRGDMTPIEGFEQDGYIENSHANRRSSAEMLHEFQLIREANMYLFRNLDDADWGRTGIANEKEISVRALAFIMAGHVRHHANIIRDRYLA